MSLPSFEQVQTFVGSVENAVNVFTTKGSSLSDDVKAALPLATEVLDQFFPELTILGVSPSNVLATAESLFNETNGPETPLTAAFGELKAAVSGGPAPVHDEWVKFNALADQAHSDWKAALAAA